MNLVGNKNKRTLVIAAMAPLVLIVCSVLGDAQESAPAGAASAIENGKKAYESSGCGRCHGPSGQGGGEGPAIAPDPLPLPDFIKYVRNPTGEMPAYKAATLKDSDLGDIHAFLTSVTK